MLCENKEAAFLPCQEWGQKGQYFALKRAICAPIVFANKREVGVCVWLCEKKFRKKTFGTSLMKVPKLTLRADNKTYLYNFYILCLKWILCLFLIDWYLEPFHQVENVIENARMTLLCLMFFLHSPSLFHVTRNVFYSFWKLQCEINLSNCK